MSGHRPGVPGTPGRPGAFQKFYVIFSYVPFLLPRQGEMLKGNLKRRGVFDAEGSIAPCLWFRSPSHKGSIEPFWGPKGCSIEPFEGFDRTFLGVR